MRRARVAAFLVTGLMLVGCGGGGGTGPSGRPTFEQASSVALSRLPSCPGKRAGAPTISAPSVDRERLKITDEATLECGGAVILHWFRFKDSSAREAFVIRGVGLQNAVLENGDVLVRVGNAGDVPPEARSLLPHLASDIKSACGCGEIVQP